MQNAIINKIINYFRRFMAKSVKNTNPKMKLEFIKASKLIKVT